MLLNIILLVFVSNIAQAGINNDSIAPLPRINKKFLIIAQVVLDENGAMGVNQTDINTSITNLNTYWSKIGVSFELCELRTIPNFRYDTLKSEAREKELLANFVIPDRINVFYVSSISGASGKASEGGINQPTNVAIWLQKSSLGAIVHEMGHYWGLKHTFDSEISENPDHSNCATAGDHVCDTPFEPNPLLIGSALNQGCVFINKFKDLNGNYSDPDVFNVMSYFNCGTCMKFTNGQYQKMVNTYYVNNSKW